MGWRSAVKWGVGLTALYLVLHYATGFGQDLRAGGAVTSGVVKTFQGR